MKYSEFNKNVNTDVYNIIENDFYIFVLNYKGFALTTVSKKHAYVMSSNSIAFENLKVDERLRLLDLAMALAITPLADREEEKRYYLRFIHPNILGAREPFYLHLHHSESAKDYYDMGTVKAPFGNKLQTIFTESEIAAMDITGFEKIEVPE